MSTLVYETAGWFFVRHSVCVCIYVCMYMCIYIYIYIYSIEVEFLFLLNHYDSCPSGYLLLPFIARLA